MSDFKHLQQIKALFAPLPLPNFQLLDKIKSYLSHIKYDFFDCSVKYLIKFGLLHIIDWTNLTLIIKTNGDCPPKKICKTHFCAFQNVKLKPWSWSFARKATHGTIVGAIGLRIKERISNKIINLLYLQWKN